MMEYSLQAGTEVVKQIIINIEAGVEVRQPFPQIFHKFRLERVSNIASTTGRGYHCCVKDLNTIPCLFAVLDHTTTLVRRRHLIRRRRRRRRPLNHQQPHHLSSMSTKPKIIDMSSTSIFSPLHHGGLLVSSTRCTIVYTTA